MGTASLRNARKPITNMNSCQNGDAIYASNLDAYTHHSSNIRKNSIDEFFIKVGITNISSMIICYPKFSEYINENEISGSTAFNVINDLAERRNQVAHGSVDSILDIDILLDYIDFIELFCTSLYEVLIMNSLQYRVEKNLNLYSLGLPIDVFGRNVVCFEVENVHLQLGDVLYAQTNNTAEPIRYGTIQSIHLEDCEVHEIRPEQRGKVCIGVNFKVRQSYTYFITILAVDEKTMQIV